MNTRKPWNVWTPKEIEYLEKHYSNKDESQQEICIECSCAGRHSERCPSLELRPETGCPEKPNFDDCFCCACWTGERVPEL